MSFLISCVVFAALLHGEVFSWLCVPNSYLFCISGALTSLRSESLYSGGICQPMRHIYGIDLPADYIFCVLFVTIDCAANCNNKWRSEPALLLNELSYHFSLPPPKSGWSSFWGGEGERSVFRLSALPANGIFLQKTHFHEAWEALSDRAFRSFCARIILHTAPPRNEIFTMFRSKRSSHGGMLCSPKTRLSIFRRGCQSDCLR